jgi:hypothetical protein
VVHDVQHGPHGLKTLVVVHRLHGYTLLLRMLATALGPSRVRGFPAARTFTERNDEALAPLLGLAHDEGLALASRCPCALCEFNRPDSAARVMVARLHREVLARPGDARMSALLARVLAMPGVPKSWHLPDFDDGDVPVLGVRLRRDDLRRYVVQ